MKTKLVKPAHSKPLADVTDLHFQRQTSSTGGGGSELGSINVSTDDAAV